MAVNFTQVFNPLVDTVHNNVTYTFANQPPLMTTETIFILTLLLGIGLLVLSTLTKTEMCNDFSGILAAPFAVDTVTGTGAVANCIQIVGGSCAATEWVLLENHTIYHYDLLGVLTALLFLTSLVNLYRLWLDHRKITEQEQLHKNVEPEDVTAQHHPDKIERGHLDKYDRDDRNRK